VTGRRGEGPARTRAGGERPQRPARGGRPPALGPWRCALMVEAEARGAPASV